jgi:mannose-6-phosphate isomerase-like protein (cupin superfamily)
MSTRPEAVVDLPRYKQVAGHHAPAPFLITADMFGGLDFELAGVEISGLVGKPVAEPHVHDLDEIYILISPQSGEAEIAITTDGEEHRLQSPAVFLVPAGVLHRFVTVRAEHGSFLLGILRASQRD